MQRAAWLLLTACPVSGFAHEGHGSLMHPILHQIGEPSHVLPLLLMTVGLLALLIKRRAKSIKKDL